jgi:hypothetical protein
MEVLNQLMKRPRQADSVAMVYFVGAVLYTIFRGSVSTVLVGIAFTLIVLGALPKQVALAFLVGASAILLIQTRPSEEGFTDAKKADAKETETKEAKETKETKEAKEKEAAGFTNPVVLPDNADRKEMLELGKPYKLPSEADDKGVHLDAGSTFLNAYKALKPEQIAAMTRDTQELLATQKSLVAMLDSFGPLMKDMGKITGFLGPGAGLPAPGSN